MHVHAQVWKTMSDPSHTLTSSVTKSMAPQI
jgi:hypothetical protein